MNLLSKNAPLEESIAKLEAILEDVGCRTTFSQERHLLEHCFSVNLAAVDVPNHIYSNGKGILSSASKASALGEYVERLQTNAFFADFHLPQRTYFPDEIAFEFGGDYLNDELRSVYDPEGELEDRDLVDFNSDYEQHVVALPFTKRSSGDTVYIPLNILSNLYISNGLATGNTPQEAQVQALSEIIERHVKIEIIASGHALPAFPDEVVRSFARVHADVEALRKSGYLVEVLDASLGGRFPVTAISLINPANSSLYVAFGAHPILEVSLERTMTELMQGRGLESLDVFEVPTFDMDVVSESSNIESHYIDSNGKLGFGFLRSTKSFEYAPWSYRGEGRQAEHEFLTGILDALGEEIYLREYTYLGFYTCQIIVPGFSEVYPVEDLIYNNRSIGKWIRKLVLHFEDHDPQEILDAVTSLDESLPVGPYIGVIFASPFTMRDFKAQIHLVLGDREEALAYLESGTHGLGRVVAELIRMEQQELAWQEYEEGLFQIFGREPVERALRILDGEELLIDTTLHGDYDNMLAMVDRLEPKKKAAYRPVG